MNNNMRLDCLKVIVLAGIIFALVSIGIILQAIYQEIKTENKFKKVADYCYQFEYCQLEYEDGDYNWYWRSETVENSNQLL